MKKPNTDRSRSIARMWVCVWIGVLAASYSPIHGQQPAEGSAATRPDEAGAAHYKFTTLDAPPINYLPFLSFANGINDEKTVVGESAEDQSHGFIYAHGQYTVLDAPGEARDTELKGINNRGEIVGIYQKPGPGLFGFISAGFLYDRGNFRDINSPDAPCGIVPRGINDTEAVAGYYFDIDCNRHGFLMEHGHFVSLDAPDSVLGFTSAYGLNNREEVVGLYLGFDDLAHGFVYSRGSYTKLDNPTATDGTEPFGINNSGDVAGYYGDVTSPFHGFVYSRGKWETVDVPGANSGTQIFSINDHGDLAGLYGVNVPAPPDHCKVPPCFDLEIHGFLATRIEPED